MIDAVEPGIASGENDELEAEAGVSKEMRSAGHGVDEKEIVGKVLDLERAVRVGDSGRFADWECRICEYAPVEVSIVPNRLS